MYMDIETKGALLIKTKFGIVSVNNFTLPPEKMINNQDWLNAVGAQSGIFCLVPDELEVPF